MVDEKKEDPLVEMRNIMGHDAMLPSVVSVIPVMCPAGGTIRIRESIAKKLLKKEWKRVRTIPKSESPKAPKSNSE